jgi:ankyrin repeat protein
MLDGIDLYIYARVHGTYLVLKDYVPLLVLFMWMQDGSTPLHFAAYNEHHPAVVEALLAAGADVEAKSRVSIPKLVGLDVLMDGRRYRCIQMYTLAYGIYLASMGYAPLLPSCLFMKGGGTPLHYGAQSGHVAVVEALVVAGADIGAKDCVSINKGSGWIIYE